METVSIGVTAVEDPGCVRQLKVLIADGSYGYTGLMEPYITAITTYCCVTAPYFVFTVPTVINSVVLSRLRVSLDVIT